VVYPYQCDAMGHMNVQYYVAAFDQAFWHLVASLGYSTAWIHDRRQGWADVRYEIDYRSELRPGEAFVVHSEVAGIGRTSLTTRHEMTSRDDDRVCAALLARSVYFDLAKRRSMPIPDGIRHAAEAASGDASRSDG
jgi:acyl-CoA thioester hydrolase